MVDQIETVMKMFGVYEFLPSNEMMADGGKYLCKDQSLFQEVCANVLFLISGYNSEQLNRTILPTILDNTPAGNENSFELNCELFLNLMITIFRIVC